MHLHACICCYGEWIFISIQLQDMLISMLIFCAKLYKLDNFVHLGRSLIFGLGDICLVWVMFILSGRCIFYLGCVYIWQLSQNSLINLKAKCLYLRIFLWQWNGGPYTSESMHLKGLIGIKCIKCTSTALPSPTCMLYEYHTPILCPSWSDVCQIVQGSHG